MRRRTSRWRDETGAAALEFALVSFVLFPLVFGMVDYGLYFTDSLGARDGVRAAARDAVVKTFSGNCDASWTATGDPQLRTVACLAIGQANAIGGTASARVIVNGQWKRGNSLTVCVAITDEGVARYVPLPNGRTVRAALHMRIEDESSPPGNPPAGSTAEVTNGGTFLPSSAWSGWCG